jgi:hypothetical protein
VGIGRGGRDRGEGGRLADAVLGRDALFVLEAACVAREWLQERKR